MAGTERLSRHCSRPLKSAAADARVKLRKANFDVMLYPVEDHAFKEASSWADEYKRIFRLFEQTLKASK